MRDIEGTPARRREARAAAGLTAMVVVGLLVVGLLGPGRAQMAPPATGAAGIGDPYFPLDGNGGIDVRHYDVDVRYSFPTAARPAVLSGTTTLTLRATQALRRFNLDLLLGVDAVRVDGTSARFAKDGRHELQITPPQPLRAGQVVEVAVDYHGQPGALAWGGERNWLGDRSEVVTMNEPHMAPWWFPANDHPRDKATFDVAVTTAADKVVISNGEQVARTAATGGLATTRWRVQDPMTTYLAFFAAGDFEVRSGTSPAGTPVLSAISRRFAPARRAEMWRVLGRAGQVTDWLERELGPYPFTSTGGLVTALTPGFALENQTRPTYGGWIDPSVQVHELAHQWFGDSVAVRRWRDIWLNEGFATYLEVRYAAAHGGRSTFRWLREMHALYAPDRGYWRLRIGNPGPENLFDGQVYSRGAMAVAALQRRIGQRDFDRVLRRWVRLHHDRSARVGDFVRLSQRVSGERLRGFYRAWLHAPRAPERTRANGLR